MEWTKHGDGTPESPEVWVSDNGWYAIEKHPFGEPRYLLKAISSLRHIHAFGVSPSLERTQGKAEGINVAASMFRGDDQCPFPEWWK